MERMTGFDASLLYLETAQQMLVVGGILVVDVSDPGFEYSFERLRAELARRVKEIPEFRRKIYDSVLNLGHPAWVEEYDLDMTQHVRRVDVEAPGDDDAVFEMCGSLSSRPLDRSRPLWQMWVLEGLATPDTVAVFFRAHHALLDGTSAAAVLQKLGRAGTTPSARDLEPVRVQAGGANPIRLVAGGLWDFSVRRPLTLARLVPEAAMLPRRLRRSTAGKKSDRTAVQAAEGADVAETTAVPDAAPFTAPRTRFNATITPRRAVWGTSLDLSEIKEVKNAFGVTVNDVFLSVVGGGLRRYLQFHDDLPEKPLVAVVPVSTRGDEGAQGNNRVTVLFASLGTDIHDPLERLRAVARGTRRGKKQARGGMRPGLIQDVATLAPSTALSLVMRLYGDFHLADLHPVIHNVSVSNFPGPRETQDFLGARVTHMYPLGPLMHGSGLSVTAMSLGDQLDVGVNACEHLVPDPEMFATGLRESMDSLLELTRGTAAGAEHAGTPDTGPTPPGSTTTEEG
ncbi:wax ester/triacylglycerol synthase family O-acyltransferase [Dietzia sp. SLG310A2-38A2]|uniref:WS/DGAT/MGAT family O-acyltransferase n=1 Tax=Dietzia sp. SLG310A2-38A2 TaxID=1630643 RepID=UPI0015F99D32|nr:wax ester/triacylglycerol synthase family O-acyltransferase [Dietzia sp. SLG310A2-38A2]MBB1029648.1 wax ester/triacylglycerol synthase family O-acyltransferase [Dietzia sp. SLG310A2-38A2]